jgi:hypothetical protein
MSAKDVFAPGRARRTVQSTATGALWKVAVWLAGAWCRGTCCIGGDQLLARTRLAQVNRGVGAGRGGVEAAYVRAVSRGSLRGGVALAVCIV